MYANLQTKQTILTFLAQICPKRNLKLEIRKTNIGIRISILEIPCVQTFRQDGQLLLFGPKFAQKWILGSKFQKSKSAVCNFQSMKSSVELNSLLSKFFYYITWLLYQLIRCDTGRVANEAFTSNPFVYSKQQLNGLKITNCLDSESKFMRYYVTSFQTKRTTLGSKFQKLKSGFGINTSIIP